MDEKEFNKLYNKDQKVIKTVLLAVLMLLFFFLGQFMSSKGIIEMFKNDNKTLKDTKCIEKEYEYLGIKYLGIPSLGILDEKMLIFNNMKYGAIKNYYNGDVVYELDDSNYVTSEYQLIDMIITPTTYKIDVQNAVSLKSINTTDNLVFYMLLTNGDVVSITEKDILVNNLVPTKIDKVRNVIRLETIETNISSDIYAIDYQGTTIKVN